MYLDCANSGAGTGTAVINKHTQGSRSYLVELCCSATDFQASWPSRTELSRQNRVRNPGLYLKPPPKKNSRILSPSPSFLPPESAYVTHRPRQRKRAKHDGAEEARRRRRRPWQRREYQRQGKVHRNDCKDGSFHLRPRPQNKLVRLLSDAVNSRAILCARLAGELNKLVSFWLL